MVLKLRIGTSDRRFSWSNENTHGLQNVFNKSYFDSISVHVQRNKCHIEPTACFTAAFTTVQCEQNTYHADWLQEDEVIKKENATGEEIPREVV